MTDEEMAKALKVKGWRVKPPLTPANCRHLNMIGSGSIGADGSSHFEGRCSDCGYSYSHSTPPRSGLMPLDMILRN